MSTLISRSDRQARYAQRLTGLGLVQVSAWVPEEQRWAVSRVAESARVDAAGLAADYVTALVGRAEREMADSFMESGGSKIAYFHQDRDGMRKIVGVKIIPWRCTPVLIPYALTPDTNPREVANALPTLDEVWRLRNYSWETPDYRRLCIKLEIDPDEGRPRFIGKYERLGEKLVEWVSDRFSKSEERWEHEPADKPGGENLSRLRRLSAVNAVCDFVDLLRVDGHPTPTLLDEVRHEFHDLPHGMLHPYDDILRQMANCEELLEHGRVLVRQGKQPATEFEGGPRSGGTAVEFLPSRYGLGYIASIYNSPHGDEDGWKKSSYGHLRGVALEPTPEELARSSWLTIVVRRLKAQGVLFMTREQAQTYLNTEAPYWVYGRSRYFGHCRLPEGLTIREPSWGERQWWRMKRPPMSVNGELVRREALHPL
jgi:hypothetical protein